ncbi:hypothetical protein [Candidatus Cyanaurora vandensis]|uniref:hypothetical protein n=1 Tax=Candidatus Cyanaurora vandensis TaxID=2714958 RepID=UPI00257AD1B7|nr:hypothetical protein [Candidatus Cyanaurora vandensis]
METQARLLKLAEDELAQYSTPLRKLEKLRPKVAFLPVGERAQLKALLQQELATGGQLASVVEQQRQAVALPFYGITGLALLAGFLGLKVAWVIAALGVAAAFTLQRLGWQRQARRLLLTCIEDLERRS